jgi:hypothetical protein
MNIGIVVFAFNRPKLLASSLESLMNCQGAESYPVTIFVDGPRNDNDKVLIAQTINIINNLRLPNLKLVISDYNKGLARSVIDGVTDMFSIYDALIVLEDDLTYSPNFLNYMNISLNHYEKQLNVASVSGYSFEIGNESDNDNYFHPRPTSWGWSTWKDRWLKVNWGIETCDTSFINMNKFAKNGQDLPRMLKATKSGVIDSWAVIWAYKHFENNWLSSYPYISLVDNVGFGEQATNCKGENHFKSSFLKTSSSVFSLTSTVKVNKSIIKKFNSYNSNYTKLKRKIGNMFKA